MNANTTNPPLTPLEKKPYRSPKLVVYGNLRHLTKMFTMAKGGVKGDGGGGAMTRL